MRHNGIGTRFYFVGFRKVELMINREQLGGISIQTTEVKILETV